MLLQKGFPIFVILLLVTQTAYSQPVNYCTNPKVNQEWDRLIEKHKSKPEWRSMYDLRKELCTKVENGEVTLGEAIEQFETERAIMVEQLRERIERKHGKQTGKA